MGTLFARRAEKIQRDEEVPLVENDEGLVAAR
jgi:hypothetical protein